MRGSPHFFNVILNNEFKSSLQLTNVVCDSCAGRGHHHKVATVSAPAKQKFYWSERKAAATTTGRRGADTVEVAGSSLPDCSHACGSCSPCRLVMISFVCASLQEAETCPMAYRCMCNNKSYPVPWSKPLLSSTHCKNIFTLALAHVLFLFIILIFS